jgi:hypothetical protein
MHAIRWAVPLLVLVLATGGCSSDDPAAPDGTESSAATPSASPSVSEEPAASAELTACDLLAPADYKRFIRPDLRGTTYERAGLDGYLGTMGTCQVWSANFRLLTFGYSTDTDAWPTIERQTRPGTKAPRGGDPLLRKMAQQLAQKRQSVPNVGQEGYFSSGFGFGDLWALNDDVSYLLSPSALVPAGDLSIADYMAVMITMTSHASEGVRDDPVDLPSACPAADSPEVVEAIGEVVRASGSTYERLAPTCDYLAEDGRTLSAGSTFFGSSRNFTREAVLPETLEGMEILDPSPGPSSGIRRDASNWVYHSALPARLETVTVTTGRASWGPRPTGSVDRSAFLAFVDSYRALASEQLGADY